ncbi:hypothetical protein F7725_012666 [Dissostichus mawsoni]|uniref:NADP-dependent oxidoreductase domain-containing protein n=1 Tax=Dissostichus mawsoni TaxID=36200 RepID=A0A7J5YMW8_DISMA|nr:hypothetical protein F7725_012666 [Dissostichus mawsoni]
MKHERLLDPLHGAEDAVVGLGTWKSAPGQVKQAVLAALDCGYRHIDCAAAYGNEQEVGGALSLRVGSGKALRREDVFVTSKLWNTKHDPEDVEEACRTSLAHLGLLPGPVPHALAHGLPAGEGADASEGRWKYFYSDTHYRDTWAAMESLVDEGLVKAIGLSNFNARQMDDIISTARHAPVVNQVPSGSYVNDHLPPPLTVTEHTHLLLRSVAVCLTAYSPLGSGDRPWAAPDDRSLLTDPRLAAIARDIRKHRPRIQQNMQVLDFSLSEDDMKLLESFNCNQRLIVPAVERDGKRVWRDAEHPHFPFNDPY